MGETGSITRGWKEEESCTREWFCVLGLGKPRPKTQNHSHSARATIPSSGWIATRLCVAGSLGRRMNHSLVQDSSSFHPLVMEPLSLCGKYPRFFQFQNYHRQPFRTPHICFSSSTFSLSKDWQWKQSLDVTHPISHQVPVYRFL